MNNRELCANPLGKGFQKEKNDDINTSLPRKEKFNATNIIKAPIKSQGYNETALQLMIEIH